LERGFVVKRLLLLFLVLCFAATSYAAERNLFHMFEDRAHLKVYVKAVTSDIDDEHVKVKLFEKIFKDVLRKRSNLKFVPVESAKEADVMIGAKIKRYVFIEKTMPSFFGTAALVADTASPKSEAQLVVNYVIMKPKNDRVISDFENFGTSERRPIEDMKGEKAFEHAARKNINRFIYKAFRNQSDFD